MWTPAHTYLNTNSFVHTENVFRSALPNAGKRSDLSGTASSGRPALSLFSTEQRWSRFPTTMLSFSWINLPNISISGLIKPRSENIVQILVATFTLLALLPHSFYFHSILRDRLILRLADPKFMTFRSPFYLSFGCSQLKNFSVLDYHDNQCDESLLHAIRTICVFV